MYPHLFDKTFLNTCGSCIAIGLILCFVVGRYYARVKGMNRDYARALERSAYVAIAFGFVSAAVFQAFYNYLENPSAGFHITKNVTFLGGLIGGIAMFLLLYLAVVRRKFGARLIEAGPVAPLCISIAQVFGRMGCFFGGCCYGKPTNGLLGVRFPNLGYKALPTQLFEAAFLLTLFVVLFYLVMKRNFKQSFALYMLCYGIFRFCIEYIRDDPRGALIGSLSPSQTISLLMIAGSVPVYYITAHLLKAYRANPRLTDKI